MTEIDTGISADDRALVGEELKKLLADTYTLYLQTQNFHWNVTGPHFRQLHLMFEEQYGQLANAVDAIAERIRSLDIAAPATFKAFTALQSIEDADGVPSSNEMVSILAENHQRVIRTARNALAVAESASDEASADMVTDRLDEHEKTAWMLRASTH
ncbi:MAG: DNA starvation/stationary phase protection protein [Planctomycetaceae bacterium]|nr:DNA starvation/stationary phase protection protein [Planctomycetaceae bacterium]|tara:strand:- start:212 stop:682 length:471 start_codon:yes stop_codon:yes gene_type:complete